MSEQPPMMGGFLVISTSYSGSWGWGETLRVAKARYRDHYGQLSRGYAVYTFAPDTEVLGVTGWGAVEYKGDEPTMKIVKPRKATP